MGIIATKTTRTTMMHITLEKQSGCQGISISHVAKKASMAAEVPYLPRTSLSSQPKYLTDEFGMPSLSYEW